jgi:hypothetical protein
MAASRCFAPFAAFRHRMPDPDPPRGDIPEYHGGDFGALIRVSRR